MTERTLRGHATRRSAPTGLAPPPTPHRRATAALAVIVTCQLMVVLDATIVNIALPNIQRGLGFSAANLSWVINAYTLVFGGLLLLGGRAGDALGRRAVFTTGIAVFTTASLLGGLATTPTWLITARVIQGLGAAAAAPSALALIAVTFPEGIQRNRALGVFSAVSAGGGSLGLLLGGALTSWASWRWVMFINVPIGLAVLCATPWALRETHRHRTRLDIPGAATATLGTACLVYGFIHAATAGWATPTTITALSLAALALASLVILETRAASPIMPLHLLRDPARASAYAAMLLLASTMFGMFYLLSQYVQDTLGYSPIATGLAFLPMTLVLFAASRVIPRLLAHARPGPFVIAGTTLAIAGTTWLTQLSPHAAFPTDLLGPLLLFGTGAGCCFMPLTMTVLAGVARTESGAAAGLLQTTQQVGGSIGLAVLATVEATAAAHAHGGATALTHGAATAFAVATGFATAALALACALTRATR